MTNFERIKAMSVEEMAEFLAKEKESTAKSSLMKIGFQCYPNFVKKVKKSLKEWLESEVQENDT